MDGSSSLTVETMIPGEKGYVSPQALWTDGEEVRIDPHVPVRRGPQLGFVQIERTSRETLVFLATMPEGVTFSTGCRKRPQPWDLRVRLI